MDEWKKTKSYHPQAMLMHNLIMNTACILSSPTQGLGSTVTVILITQPNCGPISIVLVMEKTTEKPIFTPAFYLKAVVLVCVAGSIQHP